MPNTDSFDPTPYQTIPQVDVATSIALGNKLLRRVPKKCSEDAKNSAKKLRASLEALNAAFVAPTPGKAASVAQKRQADSRIDRSWSALFRRVDACAMLDAEQFPSEVAEAQSLLDGFFSEGLKFLTLPYETEWAESDKRLQRIDNNPELAKSLDRIAGPMFVIAVRKAHAIYGTVLGITEALPDAEAAASLDIPRTQFRKALDQYCRALVGTVDEDKPDTVTTAVSALAPLVELRDRLASGKKGLPEDDIEPADPAADAAKGTQ